jgi:dihydroorotate dehydrogenase
MVDLFPLARPLLHALPAEAAHRVTLRALALGLAPAAAGRDPSVLAVRAAGLALANPVGLAAGFDKNAEAFAAALGLGFGFVEVGTVTPRPQAGNPRPRLFRLPEDRAVINRMGFNNAGLDVVASRITKRTGAGVVGANIGANKDSADRVADYVAGLKRLHAVADYLVVNVSSPNTPGLRELQAGEALARLLGALAEARGRLEGTRKPLWLKIAPDLAPDEAAATALAAAAHGFDALVVGNTTLARPADLVGRHRGEAGGLSGRPLMAPSTRLLAAVRREVGERIMLVGVGGIASGRDAYAKIRAGATLVQLYSALVYEGPALIGRIKRELAALLAADGFAGVADAVGADAR